MKKFIKLGMLGFALSMSVSAFGYNYENSEEIFEMKEGQQKLYFVLGTNRINNIYNMKTSQEVYFYPPKGYVILENDERKKFLQQTINPQENVYLKTKIVQEYDERKNAKEVEQLIYTFKEKIKPDNQTEIKEYIGKRYARVGDENLFKLNPNQKYIEIDLHEYNKDRIHVFKYIGVENELKLKLKLIAPKHYSFIFEGKPYKEYEFNMTQNSEKTLTTKLKADEINEIYNEDKKEREYKFKIKK